MKLPKWHNWYPLVITIAFFSIAFLADIITTQMFLGSPDCIESNPVFAPFSNNPRLLYGLYFESWFLYVGVATLLHIFLRRWKLEYILWLNWIPVMWYFGLQHAVAAVVNYNLVVSGACNA